MPTILVFLKRICDEENINKLIYDEEIINDQTRKTIHNQKIMF